MRELVSEIPDLRWDIFLRQLLLITQEGCLALFLQSEAVSFFLIGKHFDHNQPLNRSLWNEERESVAKNQEREPQTTNHYFPAFSCSLSPRRMQAELSPTWGYRAAYASQEILNEIV
jgi:hypothetical protein